MTKTTEQKRIARETIGQHLDRVHILTENGGFEASTTLGKDTLERLKLASKAIATLLRAPQLPSERVLISPDQITHFGQDSLRLFYLSQSGLHLGKSSGPQFSLCPSGAIRFRSVEHALSPPLNGTLPPQSAVIPPAKILQQCIDGENIYLGTHAVYYYMPRQGHPRATLEARPSLRTESERNLRYLSAASVTAQTFHEVYTRLLEHPDFPYDTFVDLTPPKPIKE